MTDRTQVRSTDRGAQFAYVAAEIEAVVRELLDAAGVTVGSRVLDYGCADGPYRHVLPAGVAYVGADLPGNERADLELSSDGTLPTADGCFDVILSTQVLEHVLDPVTYLRECARVLVPGGSLVLTTHGIMYYHPDPNDYWRWTRDGLSRVVSDAGLAIEDLRGIVGLSATAVQLFQDATSWRLPARLRRPYQRVLQPLIARLDRSYTPETRLDNPLVLAVRAVKAS